MISSFDRVEVAVLFLDLRGFTQFMETAGEQNYHIREFLNSYYRICPQAVKMQQDFIKADEESFRDSLTPSLTKFLGDGVMIIWEIPENIGINYTKRYQFLTCIVNIVALIQGYFSLIIQGDNAIGRFTRHVEKLNLGFGIASGGVYKITINQTEKDYIGRIINLASRLQTKARPGVLIDHKFAEDISTNLVNYNEVDVDLDGIENKIQAWESRQIVNKICMIQSMRSISHIYGINISEILPLIPPELISFDENSIFINFELSDPDKELYFSLRKSVEIITTRIISQRMHEGTMLDISRLQENVAEAKLAFQNRQAERFKELGAEFHKLIARLSIIEGQGIENLIESLWIKTSEQVEGASTHTTNRKILENAPAIILEHEQILSAIENGDEGRSEAAIRNHLQEQRRRTINQGARNNI